MAEQLWAKDQQLWVENRQIATAITRADWYTFFTSISVAITVATLLRMYKFGGITETWVLCHLLALSYGAQWLMNNSSFVTTNAAYVEAVVKVKKAMLGWVTLLLAQAVAYLIINGAPEWHSIPELFGLE